MRAQRRNILGGVTLKSTVVATFQVMGLSVSYEVVSHRIIKFSVETVKAV